jgi:predicted HicB family RNase H-like nuclease
MPKEKQQYSNVTVPPAVHRDLKVAASERGLSIFALVTLIVTQWLSREKEQDQ